MKEPTIRSFLSKSVSYDPLLTSILTDDNRMVLDIRGWGQIKNLFATHLEAEFFQDEIGGFVAEAINEKLNRANNKKTTLKVTKNQLNNLIASIDNHSAMIGGGDDDKEFKQIVKSLDKMLENNGIKRGFL